MQIFSIEVTLIRDYVLINVGACDLLRFTTYWSYFYKKHWAFFVYFYKFAPVCFLGGQYHYFNQKYINISTYGNRNSLFDQIHLMIVKDH